MDRKPVFRSGFTLIELLIAISILAIIAVLGWRGLDSIVRSRMALNEDLDQARGMQLTFAQLQNDCAQIAKWYTVNSHPTLIAEPNRVVMIRSVFADNEPSRTEVVTYRLRNGVLSRNQSVPTRNLTELDAAWKAALDDTDVDEAVPLMGNVAGMAIRLWYPNAQEWTSTEQVGGAAVPDQQDQSGQAQAAAQANQPKGMEMALQLKGQSSSMVKIFLLGAV